MNARYFLSMIKYMFILCIICLNLNLAPSTHAPEGIAPGDDRGGVGGGGAVPTRYQVTNRGQLSISPWEHKGYVYSISQLQIRSNSSGNLQVVSGLNLSNQAHHMYHYNHTNCTERYYPKVYLGTTQTIAYVWNYDRQIYANKPIQKPSNWPQNGPQKGEEYSL